MSSRSCATQDFIIQKVTFLSFDVAKTMAHFKRIFEKDIKEIPVPDQFLRKRGIRWLMFPKSGIHIHVCPPNGTLYMNVMREIDIAQRTTAVRNMPIKENHVGLLVPDMTPIIQRVQKLKFLYELRRRSDGMYQLYLDIDSAVDYFEIDSKRVNLDKVKVLADSFEVNLPEVLAAAAKKNTKKK